MAPKTTRRNRATPAPKPPRAPENALEAALRSHLEKHPNAAKASPRASSSGAGPKPTAAPARDSDPSVTAADEARGTRAANPPPRTRDDAPAATQGPARVRLSPEEAMRRAFEDDDVSFWEGKFEGRGTTLPDHIEIIDDSAAELEETLPSGEALTREEREFLDAVGGVRPLQQQALHHRMERVRAQAFTRVRWFSADELTHAPAVDLHEPELTAEHREVLRRARLAPMAVLNLRHDRREEALRRLAVFVRDHQRDEVRYVRVITGKGRQSEGDPVLKPAVVAWASGTGRPWVARWAPETDCSGQWGSVVLQLRARRNHGSLPRP